MPFQLPPLHFDRDALSPHMSAETLDYHHGKHHKAYVDKTNELVVEARLDGKSLVEVIRNAPMGPLRSNAGQLWNHSFFWQCLVPNAAPPSGQLARLIDADFGSTEALLETLGEAAVTHFGSGWVWLLLDRDNLKIKALHDGDTPAAHNGMVPLLAIDLWEHAYYIDYRNSRADYAKAVLSKLINWNFVAQNLDGKGVSRADQG